MAERSSVAFLEEGAFIAPKFDRDGLIPVVTTDAQSGDVLMLGFMNPEALRRSIETREAHYWSRSRGALWRKGATSGLVQRIVEMGIDDDQDAIWLRVSVEALGASCHVGYRSCFFRSVTMGAPGETPVSLSFVETEKVFDPRHIYGDAPNPTTL
ncbi:MAG TPA: phosphoribosyl-AMP cyclohydrolase [Methylocystis sp.]|jgi:phosphoribosyl-AMP cyclohydrolase